MGTGGAVPRNCRTASELVKAEPIHDAGRRLVGDVAPGAGQAPHWLLEAIDCLGEGWARVDAAGRIDDVAGPLFALLDAPRPQVMRLRDATRALRAESPLIWPPAADGSGWQWTGRRHDGRAVVLDAHALDDDGWLLRARWMTAPAPAAEATGGGTSLYHPVTRLPQPALLLDRVQQAVERSQRTVTHRFALILVATGISGPAGSITGLKAIARGLEEAVRPADTVAHLDAGIWAVLVEPVRGDDATAQLAVEAVIENLRGSLDQCMPDVSLGTRASFAVVLGDGASHPSDLVTLARSRLTPPPAAATDIRFAVEVPLGEHRPLALVSAAGTLPGPGALLAALASRTGDEGWSELVLTLEALPPLETLQALMQALARRHPSVALAIDLDDGAVARDPEAAIQLADAAAARGIGVGLAGAGRGRCPDALAARLPLSRVSLDPELAADARHSIPARVRVAAAIASARERGLVVSAPGIEDAAHAALLASLGCHRGRGPLFEADQ